jgi:antitoxin (DNA-binding transcriptional repressor) of toxin-antitoxin stability system
MVNLCECLGKFYNSLENILPRYVRVHQNKKSPKLMNFVADPLNLPLMSSLTANGIEQSDHVMLYWGEVAGRESAMANITIELDQAEVQLGKLIQAVCGGTEVVITRDGQAVARLVPPQQALTDRVPGSAKGLFVVPDDFDAPLEDFSEYT